MLPHNLASQIQNGFRGRQARVAVPHTLQNLAILNILLREGFISSLTRGSASTPSPTEWAAVPESRKRIWATLKYRNDRPVLSAMEVVSKPSRRIVLDEVGVRRLVSGHRAQFVKPLGMGEVAVVRTGDRQWMEAREAVRLNLGGEVICRAR
ncbi:mitochondrial ribosomal protein subunit S8 [Clavulina sp. PMI_390]|nr:mitochondrial ribosomal protein subunit S8 [Clavulina sp. PMI_390]